MCKGVDSRVVFWDLGARKPGCTARRPGAVHTARRPHHQTPSIMGRHEVRLGLAGWHGFEQTPGCAHGVAHGGYGCRVAWRLRGRGTHTSLLGLPPPAACGLDSSIQQLHAWTRCRLQTCTAAARKPQRTREHHRNDNLVGTVGPLRTHHNRECGFSSGATRTSSSSAAGHCSWQAAARPKSVWQAALARCGGRQSNRCASAGATTPRGPGIEHPSAARGCC